MSRTLRLVSVAVVMVLAMAPVFSAVVAAPAEQVFRFAHFGPVPTLDPHFHTQGKWVDMIALFEGLTQFDKDFKVVPNMAESWTISPDGLVYTFKLRPSLKWSNGEKITAEDFKYSWIRVLDPATKGASFDPGLWSIKNARDFSTGKIADSELVGIKVVDPLTLQVTLANPTPDFLTTLALPSFFPVPRKVIEKHGADWWKPENFVGNGAFVPKSYGPNTEAVLVRNENYWGERPALDKVIISFNFDTQQIIAYKNNEREMAYVGAADLALVEKDPVLKSEVRDLPVSTVEWMMMMRSENPVLDDVRIRQAIAMGFDREKIARVVHKNTWLPANSLFSPIIPGYDKDGGIKSDIAKAKKLLAEAGYPDGKGFPDLYFLTGPTPSPGVLAIAEELKANLGINVKIDNKDWGLYGKQVKELQPKTWVGFAVNSLATAYPDMGYQLNEFSIKEMKAWGLRTEDWKEYDQLGQFELPKAAQAGDAATVKKIEARMSELLEKTAPEAKEYERLINAAVKETNAEKRLALYQKAEQIRMDFAARIPTFYGVNKWLVKPHVKGLVQNPFRVGFPLYLKTVSIAK